MDYNICQYLNERKSRLYLVTERTEEQNIEHKLSPIIACAYPYLV